MSCEHYIGTDYGIKITLPSDWYVIETSSCVMGGQSAGYKCKALNDDGTITVTGFLKKKYPLQPHLHSLLIRLEIRLKQVLLIRLI